MTKLYSLAIALTASLVLSASSLAEAQGVASSFEQLRVLVRSGDTVRVTDAGGRKVTGRIIDLSSMSLALTVDGIRRDLVEAEVSTVSLKSHSDLSVGARYGLGVGGALGVFACLSGGCGVTWGAIFGAYSAGIGAGIGVGISALIIKERVIYADPGATSARLIVSPLATRDRKGVLLSLGF